MNLSSPASNPLLTQASASSSDARSRENCDCPA